jgi:hypothetical protein
MTQGGDLAGFGPFGTANGIRYRLFPRPISITQHVFQHLAGKHIATRDALRRRRTDDAGPCAFPGGNAYHVLHAYDAFICATKCQGCKMRTMHRMRMTCCYAQNMRMTRCCASNKLLYRMATPCRWSCPCRQRCPCYGTRLVVYPAGQATRRSVTKRRDRPAPQPLREQE